MPYINDNLEELFKNAAEDYPLKTNNSDWNSVASKINTASNPKGKNYKFLAYTIFALLLLGGSLILYKFRFESPSLSNKNISTKDVANNVDEPRKPKPVIANQSLSVSSFNNTIAAKAGHIHSKANPVSSNSIVNNDGSLNNNVQNENSVQQHLQEKIVSDKDVIKSILNIDKSVTIQKVSADKPLPSIENNKLVANNSITADKNMIKIRLKSSPKFYGSLYGGPEFSMVKFQHLANSGYQVGVALGYRINNRFDVEIGLQREHISYYTNGNYFEKTGLNLKDRVSLENVNGNSKITSVPVTLKYNFSSHSNGHFYLTTGIDAMMLTHTENYDFVVLRNGDESGRSKKYSSVTAPKYFTAINAGAGYETKLCNWCNMKIEPYYQLPISDIGVGKVQVTSFGINLGIVKNLK